MVAIDARPDPRPAPDSDANGASAVASVSASGSGVDVKYQDVPARDAPHPPDAIIELDGRGFGLGNTKGQ